MNKRNISFGTPSNANTQYHAYTKYYIPTSRKISLFPTFDAFRGLFRTKKALYQLKKGLYRIIRYKPRIFLKR